MEEHAWTQLSYIYARLGLEHQHFGETSCKIHADNFCRQNKNQCVIMIGYFMLRVITKHHHMMEYKM